MEETSCGVTTDALLPGRAIRVVAPTSEPGASKDGRLMAPVARIVERTEFGVSNHELVVALAPPRPRVASNPTSSWQPMSLSASAWGLERPLPARQTWSADAG